MLDPAIVSPVKIGDNVGLNAPGYESDTAAINAQLRVLSKDGDGLRTRLGANLQGKFGFTSETLIRYGFEPRRFTRRRTKREIELEEAAQAAAQSPETQVPAGAATPTGTEA